MIPPITREEKYMYEIVGAGETAPEKPLTRKEIFYAVILGEDRTIPRPITNAEKYLATLAGAYSEALPFPTTRIEKFLAKAAGMDVETPVPVTREEIFWDNYSAVQKFEGVPPLTFKSNGKALKNYRIYGNTVEGESVGDRTRNLFDGQLIDGYYTDNTLSSITGAFGIYQSCKISLPAGTYTIVFSEEVRVIRYIELEGTYLTNPESNRNVASYTFTLHDNNTVSLAFRNASNTTWDGTIKIQIVEGSDSLPYEPYGYRVPVEINDYTVTLYLPEPLKMVGDEAEYVDYEEQKQYFADGSYANVTLHEIPTIAGTNTLSVDTQVQPSKVYVEVGIKTGGYTIYFYNGETLLETVTGVPSGGTATYTGTTPTKESTQQYSYNFIGWNTDSSASSADGNALVNVTANRTVYAIFEQVVRGYTVYFYDGETLLQTVQNVPYGGTATFTGTEPTKEDYQFTGWLPSPTNITADTACYAQFEPVIQGLITDDWATISSRSAAGTAANYYSVGDCKAVDLKGTMGTLAIDTTLYVYILGFDHNTANGESRGITFGGFKTDVNGTDVALCDSYYGSNSSDGSKWLNMSHWGNYNYGGWKGSDMRYDILGSTNVQPSGYGSAPTTSKVGYDATSTCATTPVANTLMSCLPSDLRSVMKPMTKYTDNKGNSSNVEANVTTSIDYLPLLSEYEVQGTRTYANQYEQSKQRQYTYYSDGNSKVKYNHSATSTAVAWWVRSPCYNSSYIFCTVYTDGGADFNIARDSRGVAPAFLI